MFWFTGTERYWHVYQRKLVLLTDSNPSSIEFLLISLNLKSRSLLCGLLYCPPSSPHAVATLESALESLPPAKVKSLILLSDFNFLSQIPYKSRSSPSLTNSLSDRLLLHLPELHPQPQPSLIMSTCLKSLASSHVTSQRSEGLGRRNPMRAVNKCIHGNDCTQHDACNLDPFAS